MTLIHAQHISKSYAVDGQAIEVLHNCSLDIKPGEFVCIVGSSGSGKTTLLSILAGLDRPNKGSVDFNGQNISQMSEAQLAKIRTTDIGFVFQSFHLIPSLTAQENIQFPLDLVNDPKAASKAHDMLKKVSLSHRSDHFPHQLSGGEQQRVALARAVVHKPKIIFADEPTGNLDTKNGSMILKILHQLREELDTALVIVTHDKALAQTADRQIHIVDGKIK